MKFFGVCDGFTGAADIRLGDNFEQRRAGAVEIDAGGVRESVVQRLARVFLEMRTGQRNFFGNFVDQYLDGSALHHRNLVLADLVALGKVRVEVVLAREHGAPADLAADGEPEAHGKLDRAAVRHRQHAGQRDVDRGGLRVGLRAEGGGSTREHLAPGEELRVRLDADDDFPGHALVPYCLACGRRIAQLPRRSTSTGSRYASEPQNSAQSSATTRTSSPRSRNVTRQRPAPNCRPALMGCCSVALIAQGCPAGATLERHSKPLSLPPSTA